ncbi:short chain dehydrogenase oxidoreductase [Fusarium napiforme]|uniref:Short chain dehydrogenase oxidoreductase n=1 Tax=Fusarium napiforme TaxID=42672 RepID=A0A8H5I3T4_9HYPO|nr:short chain dehydrogenase oxidoreductase [Fusarium napiforme]
MGRADSIKEAVEVYRATYGSKLDILANVAGVMDAFASADTMTDDVWERCININLKGPTLLTREVLPLMKNRGQGSIINVGSKSSTSGASAGVAYTASKHALAGVTKNVAWRFRNEGIRCNASVPGGFDGVDKAGYTASADFIGIHVPPGTEPTLRAEHVANTIAFLASDLAEGITGAIIPVDRGWSC